MIQTFNCPNCGASLDYEGGSDLTIDCPYCKSSIIVPQELRAQPVQSDEGFESANLGGLLNNVVRLASPLGEIARLARAGKKIEAVKLYRQTFNVGLQEAKEAVDKIERGEPLTMTNVTVEQTPDIEPSVLTGVKIEPFAPVQIDLDERQVKKTLGAVIAATIATPMAIFAIIVACLVLFFLAFYLIVILPLRSHPVYRVGMELVKNDAAVIERFGSPIKDSFLVFGTTSGSLYSGETANLQGFISGPRARGTVFIFGTKNPDGTCSISSITIRIGDEMVLAYSGPELEEKSQHLPPEVGIRLPPTAVLLPTLQEYASVVFRFGGEGIGAGWFEDARSIAVDGRGNIYVAEYTGGRVQVFDPSGKFITQWFIGDSKTCISDMTADRQGTVYVSAGKIQRVEGTTGKLLGELDVSDGHFSFEAIALTPDGGLLAIHAHETLVRFDAAGKTVQVLQDLTNSPTGEPEPMGDLAVDGLGNIYIAAVFDPTIFKFKPDGEFIDRFGSHGDAPGQFVTSIEAIAVDNQGRVYAADFDGIKVFDAAGGYLGLIEVDEAVRAMVFNDQNELFVVTSVQQVIKFRLN